MFENDALKKSENKRIYTDADGKHKRRQKFERNITLSIVIGEYTINKVQEIYNKFLQNIPLGIYVDGNYVSIEPTAADWMDNEDTIIRAKCAVQITVVCRGGVYKDTDFAKADNVALTVNRKDIKDAEERKFDTGL